MMKISLHSCVVLMGVTLSGKTTWAHANFTRSEILSVQELRQELTGRADNYTQDRLVWQELYRRAHVLLTMGQRVVIDSTNLKKEDLSHWRHVCSDLGVPVTYVHFDVNLNQLLQRAHDHGVQEHVIQRQHEILTQTLQHVKSQAPTGERVITPDQAQVVSSHQVLPERLLVVGDVHGNLPGMQWAVNLAEQQHRHLVWLGDVVDYGSHNLACVKLAHTTVSEGRAHMIWGNHERKIDRWIQADWGDRYRGRLSDANWLTVKEIQSLNSERRARFAAAWRALSSWSSQHVVRGAWCMTHGAAHESMWNQSVHRLSGEAGNMAFFGEVSPHAAMKADGYPNRTWKWVDTVPKAHTVVVGHDYLDRINHAPVIKVNNQGGRVICMDTGSSKGGVLSALAVDIHTDQFEVHQFAHL